MYTAIIESPLRHGTENRKCCKTHPIGEKPLEAEHSMIVSTNLHDWRIRTPAHQGTTNDPLLLESIMSNKVDVNFFHHICGSVPERLKTDL